MRNDSVSTPCKIAHELNGLADIPRSRNICTRALMMYEPAPSAGQYERPWYDGSGSVKFGKRPLAAKSNFPPSMIAPAIELP